MSQPSTDRKSQTLRLPVNVCLSIVNGYLYLNYGPVGSAIVAITQQSWMSVSLIMTGMPIAAEIILKQYPYLGDFKEFELKKGAEGKVIVISNEEIASILGIPDYLEINLATEAPTCASTQLQLGLEQELDIISSSMES